MCELGLAYEAAAGYEEAAEVFKAIYDMDTDFRDVASKVQASAHSGEFIPADDAYDRGRTAFSLATGARLCHGSLSSSSPTL